MVILPATATELRLLEFFVSLVPPIIMVPTVSTVMMMSPVTDSVIAKKMGLVMNVFVTLESLELIVIPVLQIIMT
jgi:hypothetical protein